MSVARATGRPSPLAFGAWIVAGLLGNVATSWIQTLFACEPLYVFKPIVFELGVVLNSCFPLSILIGGAATLVLYYFYPENPNRWLQLGLPLLFLVVWVVVFTVREHGRTFMDCTI